MLYSKHESKVNTLFLKVVYEKSFAVIHILLRPIVTKSIDFFT